MSAAATFHEPALKFQSGKAIDKAEPVYEVPEAMILFVVVPAEPLESGSAPIISLSVTPKSIE